MDDKDPWWTSGEFWSEFAPLMFDTDRRDRARQDIEEILALTSPPPGARILDAGCGPGRHTLELARRGYDATGIDLQQAYLDEALASSETMAIRPEFRNEDLRSFSPERKYNGAISMYINI